MVAILLSVPPFAACSTLPPRDWPARDERTVFADYTPRAGEPIELPSSSIDLTILSLAIEPPPRTETFRGGRRLVLPPADCTRVRVTCSYRAYARDGHLPTAAELFPGATVTPVRP